MLKLENIRNDIYKAIKDDPTGNGAYLIEEINNYITEAFINFCIESEIIKFSSHVNTEKYCYGLYSIFQKPKDIKIEKQGNLLKTSQAAYIVWTYAACEIISCGVLKGCIKHTEGLGDLHKNALIFYSLSKIYFLENNNNRYAFYNKEYKDLFSKIRNSKTNAIKEF